MRLAATVATEAEAQEFRLFLDRWHIWEEDRVIRRIASWTQRRESHSPASALEITVTAEGVYWHPGAEDATSLIPGHFSACQRVHRGASRL